MASQQADALKKLQALGFGNSPPPRAQKPRYTAEDHPALVSGAREKFMPTSNKALLASQGKVLELQTTARALSAKRNQLVQQASAASAAERTRAQRQIASIDRQIATTSDSIHNNVAQAKRFKSMHKAAHITWIVFAVMLALGVVAAIVVFILWKTNNLGAKKTVPMPCIDGDKYCKDGQTYTYSKHGRITQPDFDPRVMPALMKMNGKDPKNDKPTLPRDKALGQDYEVYGEPLNPTDSALVTTAANAARYVPHSNGLVDGGKNGCVSASTDGGTITYAGKKANPCNCSNTATSAASKAAGMTGDCITPCMNSCKVSPLCMKNDGSTEATCVSNCQSMCPGKSPAASCNVAGNAPLTGIQQGCNQSADFYAAFNSCVDKFQNRYPVDQYPNSSASAFCKMACADPRAVTSGAPHKAAKCQDPFVPHHETFKCMTYIDKNFKTKAGQARAACLKPCTYEVHGLTYGAESSTKTANYGKQTPITTVGPKQKGCTSTRGWDDIAIEAGLTRRSSTSTTKSLISKLFHKRR